MADTRSALEAVRPLVEHPALDRLAEPLSAAVHWTFRRAGATGANIKNFLHGTWLGHPVHPALTDVPLGAWTAALALDSTAGGDAGMHRAATCAIGVGVAGAVGAAAAGLTDWSETDGKTRRAGLAHGLTNLAATALFTAAFVQRRRHDDRGGRACAWLGYALAIGAAWIGGDLVYGRRVGVTHADVELPDAFTPALDSAELAEGTMARARAGDADVLVARQHGRVCSLVHACSHLGGPLSEGTLKDGSVVCPWHGSEFALTDGRVLNGPATAPQPCLAVRERDGRIEVKAP
jgi:nitrite reductase/ring-hydroxylating ferredoxin subunit